jgi:hypothetical protein
MFSSLLYTDEEYNFKFGSDAILNRIEYNAWVERLYKVYFRMTCGMIDGTLRKYTNCNDMELLSGLRKYNNPTCTYEEFVLYVIRKIIVKRK